MTINIALDCMGGDNGIKATVPAAVRFCKTHPDAKVFLVGDSAQIERRLARLKFDTAQIEVINATEVVGMDEAPAQALRGKKDSSMRVAINLIKDEQAHACVSAGN
ncbi:MAG: phosphate acyltransferase, partial [Betaproteobacteria bacterium]